MLECAFFQPLSITGRAVYMVCVPTLLTVLSAVLTRRFSIKRWNVLQPVAGDLWWCCGPVIDQSAADVIACR